MLKESIGIAYRDRAELRHGILKLRHREDRTGVKPACRARIAGASAGRRCSCEEGLCRGEFREDRA